MNICLELMTREKMHTFFREFVYDPDTFVSSGDIEPYSYDAVKADKFFEKHDRPDERHFAVMLEDAVIGDLYLKQIDHRTKSCTLSIHLINDSVKNLGYGTTAERLAICYAFDELGLETVLADTLISNQRSRRVLEKVGFVIISMDESRCYYRCSKSSLA